MKFAPFIVLLTAFLAACASNDTESYKKVPDSEIIIYSCIYNAMEETLLKKQWSRWDSLENNCAFTSPYRGKMLLKSIEHPKNKLCAQFFAISQVYLYGQQNKWSEYKNTIITACFNEKTRWVFYKDDKILNTMVLDELFGINMLGYKSN